MTGFIKIVGGAFIAALLFGSGVALAACPVGRDEGDTWCEDGTEWKCERCGSEYCSIIQGSCLKDDAPFSPSALFGPRKSPLVRYAQDEGEQSGQSAMEDLENAYEDGQEAIAAPTEEEAATEAGETFDTPHDADGD